MLVLSVSPVICKRGTTLGSPEASDFTEFIDDLGILASAAIGAAVESSSVGHEA
jgi:hypothetical protein